MPKKHVRSTDPRKAAIVAALKRKSGGTKVTLLTENEGILTGPYFQGKCMRRATKEVKNWNGSTAMFEDLGVFQATPEECGLNEFSAEMQQARNPEPYDEDTGCGFYHTGSRSFDHPQIKYLGPDANLGDFLFGPYATYGSAKKDLLDMLAADMRNLQDCARQARKLKR